MENKELSQLEAIQASFKSSFDDANTAQRESLKAFVETGFPSKKSEEYKFTPVARFLEKYIDLAVANGEFTIDESLIKEQFYDLEGDHLVFVNGSFNPALSSADIQGVDKIAGSEFGGKDDPFSLLNEAFSEDSLDITIKEEKRSIFIYQIFDARSNQVISYPRITFKAETSSSVDVVQKQIVFGEHPVFSNQQTNVIVQKNASVNITEVQDFAENHCIINGISAKQYRDSRFYSNSYTFSGGMVRNNLYIRQEEENCESYMHGLYLLNGNSHVDNHTAVDHLQPNSYSNELYKGIVDEKSTGVFNGKIFVRPGAQQTNAFQSNNNISLSESATVHTKPQLEIWADDVKCSHGCTVGQLDEEAIFYLRARGIDETSAKAMLLVAFAEDTLDQIPHDAIKEEVSEKIIARLQK